MNTKMGKFYSVQLDHRPPSWPALPLTILAILILPLFLISCGSKEHARIDITVQNASTNDLDWAEIDWGGHSLSVGVMPAGKSATLLDYGLPSGTKTNVAVIKFINENSPDLNWKSGSNEAVRARRANSWTQVPVDVSRLLQLGKGRYEITFRILSLTNADVLIQSKENK